MHAPTAARFWILFLSCGALVAWGGSSAYAQQEFRVIAAQEAELLAHDGFSTDYMGSSVAMSGNVAVVGARGNNAPQPDSGSAYVFTRSGVSGTFYYGLDQVMFPFGNGFRCVGGGVFRLPVVSASASGVLSHGLDIASPQSPAGQIQAGDTLHFQAWFRDLAAGGSQFNLSAGLTLVFTP